MVPSRKRSDQPASLRASDPARSAASTRSRTATNCPRRSREFAIFLVPNRLTPLLLYVSGRAFLGQIGPIAGDLILACRVCQGAELDVERRQQAVGESTDEGHTVLPQA